VNKSIVLEIGLRIICFKITDFNIATYKSIVLHKLERKL